MEAWETFTALVSQIGEWDDEASREQIDERAVTLRVAMTETLDRHARQQRWCTRSKWWCTDKLRELRKVLAKARQKRQWNAVREAKHNQRREIRRANKTCWNSFLQNAKGNDV